MACPFFYPQEPWDAANWLNQPRVPLGNLHQGECHAQATAFRPDAEQLDKLCNVGYCRGACPHYPADAEADAFRFNVAKDDGGAISVHYIVEKACWPLRHGILEFSCEAAPGGDVLSRQAAVFAASYFRRRDGH